VEVGERLVKEPMALHPTRFGKQRRLDRLLTPEGFYLWLALDHGLSHGQIEGLVDWESCMALSSSPSVSGIILNRGLARELPPDVQSGLVLQTFGRPDLDGGRHAKVATCRIEDALRLAADAIALQLDLNASGLSHAVHALSLMISDADAYDMPVLAMVTPVQKGDPHGAVADALRICTELGADLIKVGLPQGEAAEDGDGVAVVSEEVLRSPPVLLAGGERRGDLISRLRLARACGFSGACIGRSVFQDPEPERVISAIRAVLTEQRELTP
jgi:DhnA family fructose-bisphosphate aldolase class Ia